LYAEVGRTAEAVQVIFQSMTVAGKRELTSGDWYVFGRIYEQLGEKKSAIEAYAKVMRPEGPVNPTSIYTLAQRRLKN